MVAHLEYLDPRLTELLSAKVAGERWSERWRDVDDRLGHFLRHAAATVPRHGERPRDGLSLAEFPLVTRTDLTIIEPWLSTVYPRASLSWMTTSGTSGVPLQVARDPASHYYFVYQTLREIADRIPEFGAAVRPGQAAVVILNDNPAREGATIVNPALACGRVTRKILGRGAAADAGAAAELRREHYPLLTARPRALLRLIDVDRDCDGAGQISPRAIMASGDNLHADERGKIEAYFRCRVHNGYASQEAGLVALECGERSGLHVLDAAVHVEVLGPDGALRSEGAGELVLTNLENWAMPLIRYRTGDMATVERGRCACGVAGPRITELSGRESTYFSLAGGRFNPSLLNPIFEALPVQQFQVTQREPGQFVVLWVPRCGLDAHEPVERALVSQLRGQLGDVHIAVEQVAQIGRRDEKVQRYVCGPRARGDA